MRPRILAMRSDSHSEIAAVTVFFFISLLLSGGATAKDDGELGGDYSKLSVIIIPGFASTQLRSWSILDCPYTPLDFNPLDLVWFDSTKALSAVNCWFKCTVLDAYNQTDHPLCKSRPDTGLSGITELYPGFITGPFSTVWKEWLRWCVEFGIEANAIVAAPYDWRLSPTQLEERDHYFHNLKLTFETSLKLRGGPSIVFAHSLGNNVFRYFLEWLRLEIAPKHYMEWLDQHIHAYFAIGAPLLGSVEIVKTTLSGITFGLPVSKPRWLTQYDTYTDPLLSILRLQGTTRLLSNSYSSPLWMMPFSKNCKAENTYWKHFSDSIEKDQPVYHCDEEEYRSKYSGWPTNIINIKIPYTKCFKAYPSVMETAHANWTSRVCALPNQMSFTAREIADGTFFKAIEDYDPDSKRTFHQLKKLYHDNPVMNPLTPWKRPPIKNVFCIYGVDLRTEVGYYFAPSDKPYPDNWIITDVIYETKGSLVSRSGIVVDGVAGPITGDEKVPYHSLSWCKNWLGPKVNITKAPQAAHNGSDVQVKLNVEHQNGSHITPNMTKSPRVKYITFYEDSESIPGKKTAVWELDKANHWNIVKSPVLMRELWLQMWHDIQPVPKNKFVTKAKRGPLREADCYWDFEKSQCSFQDYCEYRYISQGRSLYGDIHVGQRCKLRNTSAELLLEYL